jgi:hypothetical protein
VPCGRGITAGGYAEALLARARACRALNAFMRQDRKRYARLGLQINAVPPVQRWGRCMACQVVAGNIDGGIPTGVARSYGRIPP